MGDGILQIALYAIGGFLLGAGLGWCIQFVLSQRRISHLTSEARAQLDDVVAQKNAIASKFAEAQSRFERLGAASARQRSEFEAALEKSKLLAKNVRILRKEREDTKSKLGRLQNALASLKRQTSDLQTEFDKTREFYKRELRKSLQKRKALEEDIVTARADQEAFAKAVESSVLEHGSEEDMVIAAQLRLGQLQVLERTVDKLEAENEQLREDIRHVRQDFAAREKDLQELEQLRTNNRQLVKCVEALENSRKAHEADAERYRQQADQSEKLSDTLRLRLDDLEKNFADIEKQQHDTIEDVRKATVVPMFRNRG